jgi:branched-chain amino acid transport system ATP-binding protein
VSAGPEVDPARAAAKTSDDEPRPVLEVDHLAAGYGKTTILRDVSIRVAPGSTVALVGPNGAGKTTLLRAVSGLLGVRSGRVLLDGEDITRQTQHRRARGGLCHIPEGRGIYRTLTVRENLNMQAPRGREKEALARAVDAFPVLGGRLSQTAGTMSGGEQQMLAMAAAYARQPRVIVVDEPSLGLAPLIVDLLFESLRSLADAGTGLLIVDQFVTRVLAMADTAYVLRRGQVVYQGEAKELAAGNLFEHYVGDS